jgi:1-acyl-sn-glycerol-3-phosphate acyltransferase
VLAPPGTVLKTSSGKIRRAASKSLYESGVIGKGQRAVWWQLIRLVAFSVGARLSRWRRRGFEIIYGLYALAVFWILAPVTWFVVVLLPAEAWRWAAMRIATKLLALLTATPFRVEGLENLPPAHQPCIYVSNHGSYLDGPCVVAQLHRQFSFIAKAELSRDFIAGLFLRRISTRFVERFDTQKSIDDARQFTDIIAENQSVFFFPEGTFLRDEGLLPFRMGAFVTAAQAGVPVVPVAIRGTRQAFRAGDWLPHHHSIDVVVGTPVFPDAQEAQRDSWACAVKLRDQSRQQILELVREPDAGDRRPFSTNS